MFGGEENEKISAMEVIIFIYISPFRRFKMDLARTRPEAVPIMMLKRDTITKNQEAIKTFIDFLRQDSEYDSEVFSFNKDLANYLEKEEISPVLRNLSESGEAIMDKSELQRYEPLEVIFLSYQGFLAKKDEKKLEAIKSLALFVDKEEVIEADKDTLNEFVQTLKDTHSSANSAIAQCNGTLIEHFESLIKQKDRRTHFEPLKE